MDKTIEFGFIYLLQSYKKAKLEGDLNE